MIRNYLTIAIRQIQRNKIFTAINVTGLALAISASLLIAQYVTYELSYDAHVKNKERIFRIQEDRFKGGLIENQWAAAVGKIGPTLLEDFEEVEDYVQVFPYILAAPAPGVRHEDKFFKESHIYFSSDNFFDLFSVAVVKGKQEGALTRINTIALSQSTASKYFGDEDPIGKILTFDKVIGYEVTAVFDDFARNTHFHPDMIISIETLITEWQSTLTWHNGGYHTYVKLREGVDPKAFEAKLPAFIDKHVGEELRGWNEGIVLHLQRIDNIHLDSNFIWEYEKNGDRSTIYFMAATGIIILLIALVNYINLAIAKSLERAREVGIRKAIGGQRRQLISQFIVESTAVHLIALSVSLLLIFTSSTPLLTWLGISIPVDMLALPSFWLSVAAVAVVAMLLSSLYPALLLTNYQVIEVLKGKFSGTKKGTSFFRALTVVQFSASVALMIISYCVYTQINFMRHTDKGFTTERILVLRAPNQWDSLYESSLEGFKRTLLSESKVSYVVATSDIPGKAPVLRAGGVRKLTDTGEQAFDCTPPFVDYNYVEMLGLQMLAGKSFSEDMLRKEKKVMVNETTLTKLRITDPQQAIGEKITFWRDTFEIVGVVKNYHHESFHKAILPIVFRFNPYYRGYISVQSNVEDPSALIDKAERAWNTYFPGHPFEFFFLDDNFNRQYESDRQLERIVLVFSSVAIFIACLGLLGLTMLTTSRRIKEISIRKVLGASVASIMLLLNIDFAILMGISILIALPAGWFIADQWMSGFVSRFEFSLWIFLWPMFVALLASVAAISVQTIRAARVDPVKNLRSE